MKRTFSLVLAIMLAVCLFPLTGHQTAYAAETAVVNNPNPSDRLNLRVSPNSSASYISRYYNGVEVTVIKYVDGNWAQVQIGTGDGAARGYMQTRYLAFGASGSAVRSAIPTLRVNASSLTLRATPSSSGRSLGSFSRGTNVELLGYAASWYHVRVNGRYGYMSAAYLTTSTGGSTGYSNTNTGVNPHAFIDGKTSNKVNLRTSASTSSASMGLFFTGTQVECLSDTEQTWVKVAIGAQTGYMMRQYLMFANIEPKQPVYTVKVSNPSMTLILNAAPNDSSAIVGTIENGTRVTVLGETASHWYYVNANGVFGYARTQYFTTMSGGSSGLIVSGSVGYVNNGNGQSSHLYAEASVEYASLGLYYNGCPVTVLSSPANGWVKVRIGNADQGSQTGYMMTQYIRFPNPNHPIDETKPELLDATTIVDNQSLAYDFYDKTTRSGKVIYPAVSGRNIRVLGVLADGWLHVEIDQDASIQPRKTGFILGQAEERFM